MDHFCAPNSEGSIRKVSNFEQITVWYSDKILTSRVKSRSLKMRWRKAVQVRAALQPAILIRAFRPAERRENVAAEPREVDLEKASSSRRIAVRLGLCWLSGADRAIHLGRIAPVA